MRARYAVLFIFVSALVWGALPLVVNASIVWSSAAAHPDEVRVYTPELANIWYGGTSTSTSIQIGTWDQSDFTTTASTSARIWARWNGSYLSTLDITLRTSLGGDPFIGSGITTAQIIGPPPNFYDFRAYATSTLQEYTLPVNQNATIRRGDELWVWFYPSWASYGANHWLGSNGTVPYLEICEEPCDASASPPSITLLGDATTTAEFGSVYTDPGAEAHDAADGDLTNAIVVTGSVDTGVIGTTTLMYAVTNSGGLSATTTRKVVVACTHDCVSNVLFLPGIEGSRLYEGAGCGKTAEEKLWDPVADSLIKILRGAGDDKVRRLFLDSTGKSVCSDIYAKADGVIDSVRGNNIYKSFINEMNALKSGGMINAWKPVAYDWRLSLSDLLNKGAERNGKIFYTEATSTPYIEQTLRALASSSKTGKVTIVAHSNGGLVAKALLNKLGGELVDKLIMVGAPQTGAPVDIGALLYGMDQGISSWGIPILHADIARQLAENSPMAYHLLPSEDYLKSIESDANHPVAHFAGNAYAKEVSAYGATINSTTELDNFLIASTTLNSNLIDYANSQHTALDIWTPPDGIEVSQIAGWGADTVAGVDFYTPAGTAVITALEPQRKYKPIFTEDGDGTVPVPSALMMATSTSVKRYWIDLDKFNRDHSSERKHKDLLEIPSLENFIKNIIKNSTSTLPAYILSSQPSSTSNKKLTFFLHSPLTLDLADSLGNVTGVAEDGSMAQDILGSSYGEFGEVKYIIVPEGNYTLNMNGQASGTFTLEMQESSGGVVTTSSTIANVPTTENTLASLTISGGINTASALAVDEDGDGATDITITPQIGETVNYEPPAPAPEPQSSSGGGGGGGYSTSVTVPVVIITATSTLATTTPAVQTISTSTPESATPTIVVQAKKPPVSVATVNNSQEAETEKKIENIPQTASVYDASQQSVLKKLGGMVYNSLHSLWLAIMRFF